MVILKIGAGGGSEGGLVKDQTFSGYFFATFPKNILWNQLFQSSLSLPKVFLIILGTRSVTTLVTWIPLVLRQPWILLTLPQNPALCKPNQYLCHHNQSIYFSSGNLSSQQHRAQGAKNRQWPPSLSKIPPHPITSCLKRLFCFQDFFLCSPSWPLDAEWLSPISKNCLCCII